jgi:hypothetical protein
MTESCAQDAQIGVEGVVPTAFSPSLLRPMHASAGERAVSRAPPCRPGERLALLSEEVHVRGHDDVGDPSFAPLERGAADQCQRAARGLAQHELGG